MGASEAQGLAEPGGNCGFTAYVVLYASQGCVDRFTRPGYIGTIATLKRFALASITIPDVDEKLKASLEERAARRGKSMEAEARDILREALGEGEAGQPPMNLYAAIRTIVEPFGGIQFELPARQPVREPPSFE